MKPFLLITGSVFALIVIAHAARMFAEPRLVHDPWYCLLTIAAAALSAWAWRLVWSSRR